ncbi:hypothetical protein BMR07_05175 [Methylococcaceae bacterium CS1]|nr:hypothetical protein BMR10_02935 [Methylococcaceae bacterium CS4]TXL04208.1 hypothetical protein BMR09_13130 [Methylococcaceae bacterium CS3]TXL07328.1 hypothetical protein BMR07_05175 [Methylococcaceae bacterium CS1]TXL11140.1 hypothetical protein BMR08_05575 [Methylococcaceae bacterium CS2]
MHRITLNVQDNRLAQVMQVLKQLPENTIEVIKNEVIQDTGENEFDFSAVKIEAFKKVDPVEWQRKIRDEWE